MGVVADATLMLALEFLLPCFYLPLFGHTLFPLFSLLFGVRFRRMPAPQAVQRLWDTCVVVSFVCS